MYLCGLHWRNCNIDSRERTMRKEWFSLRKDYRFGSRNRNLDHWVELDDSIKYIIPKYFVYLSARKCCKCSTQLLCPTTQTTINNFNWKILSLLLCIIHLKSHLSNRLNLSWPYTRTHTHKPSGIILFDFEWSGDLWSSFVYSCEEGRQFRWMYEAK